MDYQVNVKFAMTINQDGEERIISFSSPGSQQVETTDGEMYMTLTYDEPVMEVGDIIHVKMKLSPDKLTIIRQGDTKSMQIYRMNEKTQCHIVTEHVTIPYEVITHHLSYNALSINLEYELLFDESVQGHFTMKVAIEPQEGVES